MSDTPRTNAEAVFCDESMIGVEIVGSDFARQLERELAEAQRLVVLSDNVVRKITTERDQWREAAEGIRPFVSYIHLGDHEARELRDLLEKFRKLKEASRE